ncbi:LexA family protein [Salmonirosea aquatica]|uniref:Translesion error-prone DNA polymerase V autoproteolytic subunit n=1 Tax=Salmonirosea aquatica TaxID=2654236 RepID=A0A7C9BGR9_9BACT|nr:translesion error-prone DNA polymerase V autoproteolytic subunit [Cytophagaceae bacterium SJW1-29]
MQHHDVFFQEIILHGITEFEPVLLPKFATNVECGNSTTGFASPADDYIETTLDLNEYHNIKKHACFLVEAVGDSMIDAGITEDDLLIVDTSLDYRENDIVICCLNGSYKAKMIQRRKGILCLISRNPLFDPIEIQEHDDLRVFGVVKGFSRNFRRD